MSAAAHGVPAPLAGAPRGGAARPVEVRGEAGPVPTLRGATARTAGTPVRRDGASAAAAPAAQQAATRVDAEGRTWIAGIGEPLPAGETLVWAGSPLKGAVARRIFKVRALSWYFVALCAFVLWVQWSNLGLSTAVTGTLTVAAMAGAVLAFCAVFAALVARSTVYAITDRRVVLRIGVAVPAVLNVPLHKIESVDLRREADGTGDVVLTLGGDDRIAYLLLWPHARPWVYTKPQPALRCIPDAVAVGLALAEAVQAAQAEEAQLEDGTEAQHAGAATGAVAPALHGTTDDAQPARARAVEVVA